jgi:predicted nucleic acid-binding protein
MIETFVDSFFWIGALNPRDPYHKQISQTPKPSHSVTTRAVQIEVMDALSSPKLRGAAVRLWHQTNSDPDLLVISVAEDLLIRAVVLYEQHKDKAWSLTDCISFVVMKDRGITEALTGDRHFEQAGFRILFD